MQYDSISELGESLMEAARTASDFHEQELPALETGWILDEARRVKDPTVEQAIGLVVGHWISTAEMPEPELRRTSRIVGQSGLFVRNWGATRWADTDSQVFRRFIVAPSLYTMKRPGYWSQYRRLRIIKNTNTTLRRLGHAYELEIPQVTCAMPEAPEFRPLLDEEVRDGWLHARKHPDSTREPTVWALGEATASTSEIPRICIEHVDLDEGRVWSPGAPKNQPRWLYLSAKGVTVVRARLAVLAGLPTSTALTNVDGRGSPTGPLSSTCRAMRRVMDRAGIRRRDGVTVSSLAAWAGRRLYEETRNLPAVAKAMGIKSLDVTARRIGLDWQPDDVD